MTAFHAYIMHWSMAFHISVLIIKECIYRTVLERAGESVPDGHEPLDSSHNTFKDCLYMHSLIIKILM
jgi:hypothetical protein